MLLISKGGYVYDRTLFTEHPVHNKLYIDHNIHKSV